MIPRALIQRTKYSGKADTGDSFEVELSWFDFHPGDACETEISHYIAEQRDEEISDLIFFKGYVIYVRWFPEEQVGITIIMASIAGDFFRIGKNTYNWINHVKIYRAYEPGNFEELKEIFQNDYTDHELDKIPKEIHRVWFDLAMKGGKILLKREKNDHHFDVANLFGFFPWIIFFATSGEISRDLFSLDVSIDSDIELNLDEIYGHIDGEMDEPFWVLVYKFVLGLEQFPKENRTDIWYQFLQAAHEFTTETDNYEEKIGKMFEYRDLLQYFEYSFLNQYIQTLLQNISLQPASKDICELLLKFSELLLEFQFTDLGKLAEATTLEHALQLPSETKREIILELTRRSSKWGEKHLISFIQSLIGLLATEEEDKDILSDTINLVKDQLNKSWDGTLCIVEGKLLSDKIGDAIELRFEATNLIADKYTKAEDIFNSIIWGLDYNYPDREFFDIARQYLDYAFDTLGGGSIVEQSDILTQKSLLAERYDFLQYYLQYLRMSLDLLDQESRENVLSTLEHLLTDRRSYSMVYIEYLLIQLYSLKYSERGYNDTAFQLVSQIFNSINPALSDSGLALEYITRKIIEFAAGTENWGITEETQRRYLLLTRDQEQGKQHLKSVFFFNAVNRAKMSSSQLNENDIGLQLFKEALNYTIIDEDYKILLKILPQMKKLAIKSRNYKEYPNLMLLNIRLHKLIGEDWIEVFLEDIEKLVGRNKIQDIKRVFKEIQENIDLTDEERATIIEYQLELVETEPDLLSADEIYEKRLELVKGGTIVDEEHKEFMIDNFQRGISELIAKGDTNNLTNLLMEAITYSQEHEAEEVEEFKEILLDNFENIIEDFKVDQSTDIYLYLLNMWKKVIGDFQEIELSIIYKFALRLLSLNLNVYTTSSNRQYLRRAQLIVKELTVAIDRSSLDLSPFEIEELYDEFSILFNAIQETRNDYGIFLALYQMALTFHRLGRTERFFRLLDTGIQDLKQEILTDELAHSAIFFLLLVLCELAIQVEADLDEKLLEKFTSRLRRVINFSMSLRLSKEKKKRIKQLQDMINQSPEAFIHELPFTLGTFLDETI